MFFLYQYIIHKSVYVIKCNRKPFHSLSWSSSGENCYIYTSLMKGEYNCLSLIQQKIFFLFQKYTLMKIFFLYQNSLTSWANLLRMSPSYFLRLLWESSRNREIDPKKSRDRETLFCNWLGMTMALSLDVLTLFRIFYSGKNWSCNREP